MERRSVQTARRSIYSVLVAAVSILPGPRYEDENKARECSSEHI